MFYCFFALCNQFADCDFLSSAECEPRAKNFCFLLIRFLYKAFKAIDFY